MRITRKMASMAVVGALVFTATACAESQRGEGDPGDGGPVRRGEDDPGSGHMLLGAVAVGDDRLETGTILGRDEGADILGHPHNLARTPPP